MPQGRAQNGAGARLTRCVLCLRPPLLQVRIESRRVAELLSQLPSNVDVEGILMKTITVQSAAAPPQQQQQQGLEGPLSSLPMMSKRFGSQVIPL